MLKFLSLSITSLIISFEVHFTTIAERLINRNCLLSYFSSVLVCVIALPYSGVSC